MAGVADTRYRWVLRVLGIAGLVSEAARNGAERPTMLLVFAGMAGVTTFLKWDEDKRDEDTK